MSIIVAKFDRPQPHHDSYEGVMFSINLFIRTLDFEEVPVGSVIELLADEGSAGFFAKLIVDGDEADTKGRVTFSSNFTDPTDGKPQILDHEGNAVLYERIVSLGLDPEDDTNLLAIIIKEGETLFLHAIVQYIKSV